MDDVKHRELEVNGIKIHIAELGSGPLVVLLHGFPSIWLSYRHQIPFLAKAGYHVVAPDMRGYGQSDVPDGVSEYTSLHLVGDVVGIIDALQEKQAFIVGHDWGSVVASHLAVMRPDLVRGLVSLSVPFFPRDPKVDMLTVLRGLIGDNIYMQRWQKPEDGEAEADFAKHGIKTALTKLYSMKSAEVLQSKNGKPVLETIELPDPVPAWLKDDYLEYCAQNFKKSGLTGPFNYYRAIRKSWELMGPWTNVKLAVPNLCIIGDQDLVITMMQPTEEKLKQVAPHSKGLVVLSNVGHFLAEEAPDPVNEHILKFFKEN